jgi:peptidyl-prolyl cis-trans isomerase C
MPACLGVQLRDMRRPIGAALLVSAVAVIAASPCAAQQTGPSPSVNQPAAAGPPSADALPLPPPTGPDRRTQAPPDPVIANVEGHPIHLSELGQAEETLPPNLRQLPFESLYPILLDRMIDHEVLAMMARHHGLEDNPQVRHEIEAATTRILEGAWLAIDATPKVTEQAVRAVYEREYANRPASEEVRARHILVPTREEAMKVIDELKKGADFATLAKQVSKDPDGQRGGDLGFFRREQVWPDFADLAFSLQPGEVGPNPIHNEFGWHVVKVEERRLVAPPGYSEVHDRIRQELLAQAIQQSVERARTQMVIHKYNLDGTEIEPGPHLLPSPGPTPR